MNISYTLILTNNSITFLSTFLDKGKDNIWIKEIIDILYKIRWGWRAKDSGQWSNPSWPQHRPQLATTPTPAGPSPFPSPAGRGVICEVTPIGLLTRVVGKFFSHGGYLVLIRRMSFSHTEDVFFSHRSHRFNRTFLRTVLISQKAFGIQISQSVSAIVDAEQGAIRSLHPAHRGISVITPLPFGGGEGGGAAIFMNLCVFCSSVFFCEK